MFFTGSCWTRSPSTGNWVALGAVLGPEEMGVFGISFETLRSFACLVF